MDIKKYTMQIPRILSKYKYAVLVLAIGLVLMAIPAKSNKTDKAPQNDTSVTQVKDPALELAGILEKIQGVGKVQVLLTVKTGETTHYQTDENTTVSENTSTVKKETVIIQDSQRNESPLIVQIIPPEYLGAVIVCQGAENAGVRLAVVDAVCKATGLGADKITVLKMK